MFYSGNIIQEFELRKIPSEFPIWRAWGQSPAAPKKGKAFLGILVGSRPAVIEISFLINKTTALRGEFRRRERNREQNEN